MGNVFEMFSSRLKVLEVLVFLSIFAIISLGNAKFVLNGKKKEGPAEKEKVAAILAKSKLDEISLRSFSDIPKTAEKSINVDSSGKVVHESTGNVYKRTVAVSQIKPSALTEFLKVVVTVKWLDKYGASNSLSRSTVFLP